VGYLGIRRPDETDFAAIADMADIQESIVRTYQDAINLRCDTAYTLYVAIAPLCECTTMSTITTATAEWIKAVEAAAILGTDHQHVKRLARAGLIGVRRLPGATPRYNRSDIERLAADCTHPARVVDPTRTDDPFSHQELGDAHQQPA
jgi:hypothetical protein